MGLGDSITNVVFGTNIKTVKVSAATLADIIEKVFIEPATTREELEAVEKTIRGNLIWYKELYTKNMNFRLYVSPFERGLITHRYVFVKDLTTEEVFEWTGYTLGEIKRAVFNKLAIKRMSKYN